MEGKRRLPHRGLSLREGLAPFVIVAGLLLASILLTALH
jgi:hypothetical protein